MATSLYELGVPTFLQTLRAVGGFLDRAVRSAMRTTAGSRSAERRRAWLKFYLLSSFPDAPQG